MKRKIFVRIDIPGKIKKRLIETQTKWADLPAKWVPASHIHLTLVFLGFADEETLGEICAKVREASDKHEIFDLTFHKIELFPSVEDARLIAAVGEPSDALKNLVNGIELTLGISSAEKKSFRPHITLGRLRAHKWAELNPKPEISEKFEVNIPAETVSIMASDFADGKNEYSVIESCPLK